MITVEFPTLKIKVKGSTYTDLFNTLMQNNDKSLILSQSTAQKILNKKFKNNIKNLEEDEAKYIWNWILECFPITIKGILYYPLKQWYKVEIYDEDEYYETEYIKEISQKEAEEKIKAQYSNDFQYKTTNRLTLEETKRCQHEDDIRAFEIDGCTRQEAEKFLKNGSFVIPAEEWDRWAKANEWYNEDELITLEKIRKGQQDIKIITKDHIEYVIVYVL